MSNAAPLRKVVETKRDGSNVFDVLECGHRWLWDVPDPRYGRGGSWGAKQRRCALCAQAGGITLSELGLYKSSLKRALNRYGRDDQLREVAPLLDRRGDWYTFEEAERIVGNTIYFATHDCVLDHGQEEGFTPLDIRNAERAVKQFEQAVKLLAEAKARHQQGQPETPGETDVVDQMQSKADQESKGK